MGSLYFNQYNAPSNIKVWSCEASGGRQMEYEWISNFYNILQVKLFVFLNQARAWFL